MSDHHRSDNEEDGDDDNLEGSELLMQVAKNRAKQERNIASQQRQTKNNDNKNNIYNEDGSIKDELERINGNTNLQNHTDMILSMTTPQESGIVSVMTEQQQQRHDKEKKAQEKLLRNTTTSGGITVRKQKQKSNKTNRKLTEEKQKQRKSSNDKEGIKDDSVPRALRQRQNPAASVISSPSFPEEHTTSSIVDIESNNNTRVVIVNSSNDDDDEDEEAVLPPTSLARDQRLQPAPGAVAVRPQQRDPQRQRQQPDAPSMETYDSGYISTNHGNVNDENGNNQEESRDYNENHHIVEAQLASETLPPEVEDLIRRVRDLESSSVPPSGSQTTQPETATNYHYHQRRQHHQQQPQIVHAEAIHPTNSATIYISDNDDEKSQDSQVGIWRTQRVRVMICCIITLFIAIVVVVVLPQGTNSSSSSDSDNPSDANNDVGAAPAMITLSPSFSPTTIEPTTFPPIYLNLRPEELTVLPPGPTVSNNHEIIITQIRNNVYGFDNLWAKTLLETTTTFEYYAAAFISSNTTILQESSMDLVQRYVLALFTFSTQYEKPSGWMVPNLHVCDWKGANLQQVQVICNSEKEMIHLQFDNQHMAGFIPSEIGLLTKLTHLTIEFNTYSPPGFNLVPFSGDEFDVSGGSGGGGGGRRDLKQLRDYKMSTALNGRRYSNGILLDRNKNNKRRQLRQLSPLLTDSGFSKIPTEIGQLSNLQILSFQWNVMGGQIPTEIGRLTDLREFNVDFNLMTGTLPIELFRLVQLRELFVAFNFFTGTIHENFQRLLELRYVSFAYNSFQGVPPFISEPPFFKIIFYDLAFNSFEGLAENYLGTSQTYEAYLQGNSFTGDISDDVCECTFEDYYVGADCLGDDAPVQCDCCAICCDGLQCCYTYESQECFTVNNLWES